MELYLNLAGLDSCPGAVLLEVLQQQCVFCDPLDWEDEVIWKLQPTLDLKPHVLRRGWEGEGEKSSRRREDEGGRGRRKRGGGGRRGMKRGGARGGAYLTISTIL